MRVVMPYFEKQQQEAGGMVDTLLPPVDPLKPRVVVRHTPMFDSSVAPSSSPLLSGE
jgi:hypothetical protein